MFDVYTQVAFDFVDKFPYTKYMGPFIDTNTGLVPSDISFNVFFVGFGQINKAIYKGISSTCHLITDIDGVLSNNRINYYFYAQRKEDFSDDMFRYYHEFLNGKNYNYLPLPKTISYKGIKMDVESNRFMTDLKARIGVKSYNYVIVSLGDFEKNEEISKKIEEMIEKYNIKNTYVFKNSMNDEANSFGKNKAYRIIVSCDKLGKARHMAELPIRVKDNPNYVINSYKRLNDYRKLANTYGGLSLRTKLNLLGFDVAPIDDERADAKEEFYQKYEYNNPIKYDENGEIIYDMSDFDTISVRRSFAFLEHCRWNQFTINSGYIPASIDEIQHESHFGRNDLKKTHPNLTTFRGLKFYAEIVMERSGQSFIQADVIKYDFTVLDKASRILNEAGLKIVKKL